MRPRHAAAVAVRVVLCFVLAWASLGKAFRPGELRESLGSLLGVSLRETTSFAIVTGIVAVELGMAFMLAVWSRPRLTAVSAAVLMTCFTGITLVLVMDPTAPPCGCLGAGAPKLLGESARSINLVALFRNIVLLAGALFLAVHTTCSSRAGAGSVEAHRA